MLQSDHLVPLTLISPTLSKDNYTNRTRIHEAGTLGTNTWLEVTNLKHKRTLIESQLIHPKKGTSLLRFVRNSKHVTAIRTLHLPNVAIRLFFLFVDIALVVPPFPFSNKQK